MSDRTRKRRGFVCAVSTLVAVVFSASGGQKIGQLTDPEQPAEEEFVDILSAWVEQDGGMLTFVIETRGNIPTTLADPEDHLTFLWLVDADNNPATGQLHERLGSEFNVRAVISEVHGGGSVDVTGMLPGGGTGIVLTQANRIEITIWLGQVSVPEQFHWCCDAFHAVDNMSISANHETAVAVSAPLPYVAPAHVAISTPLLMLCPSGLTTGMLEVQLRDADGNLLDNANYHLEFRSSNESVATVDEWGQVTAHAVPVKFWDTPVVEVTADGVPADNVAVIRVTNADLGVTHDTYAGSHVAFYLPEVIEGVDLGQITTDDQVVLATDLAYAAQQQLTGITPFRGGVHWFVLDVGDDGSTLPCGLSGNPVRLGWEFGKPEHNSCYIVNAPGNQVAQWGVIFHEMGHNMTWPSWGFGQFCSTGSPHDWKYSEALASMAGAWSWHRLQGCSSALSRRVREDIGWHYPNIEPSGRQALAEYLVAGADYNEVTVEVICDVLWDVYDDYGEKLWFDLFSTFVPVDEPLPVVLDDAEKQATWVVAAASASAGQDLRGRFTGTYGFPIDDAAWPEILASVEVRIAARAWQPTPEGDFDCDADLDNEDLGFFLACDSGPAIPYEGDCGTADFDDDNDVDQSDFGMFQRCFNGEGNPPDPNCAE